MKFADILASLIHDMKNSLGMVINTLEELTDDIQDDGFDQTKISALQQEAKRLNNHLIELLTLYKIENQGISAKVEEWNVGEFLEELVIENQASAEARQVTLEWVGDPDLNGYFDEGLMRGVVSNLLGNSLRYTQSKLRLSVTREDDYLVLRVEDDGAGFPQEMLDAQQYIDDTDSTLSERTHLGLYFAGMVASMHRNRGREGYISLTNGHSLEGGCFSIFLP
ncbi:MAG: HAMP domain-containing histidine kinase [Gammaproteobacteria bacterium]|nr:HAMP domain-containing histidine kinase [Gammaproteobacteria bacterium]